jgi:hypothetical protein
MKNTADSKVGKSARGSGGFALHLHMRGVFFQVAREIGEARGPSLLALAKRILAAGATGQLDEIEECLAGM